MDYRSFSNEVKGKGIKAYGRLDFGMALELYGVLVRISVGSLCSL